ncbi:hypothetical protein A4A49_24656 [Nicotiana attenuata]|uniref:SRR1-like domain-containing protein n=1 Tax=Nicotiana attenuata TaxID=49451 RepID=A0A314KGY6_NICAT|nr:hypothetical protein A4A49_24656 [Nicotiana attenuata]
MNSSENMESNVYFHIKDEAERLLKEIELMMKNVENSEMRQVRRPTMFYMPVPNYNLIGNFLGANWSLSCINQIFLLTNSFHHSLTSISQCSLYGETVERLERILPFTTEIDIKTRYKQIYTNVFSRFAWHFFDVDPNIDMETSLPVTKITEYIKDGGQRPWLDWQRYFEQAFLEYMQSDMTSEGFAQILGEYRGPRCLRCYSVPPPLGWIKLNIYGIGTEGDQQGRYSGVFQDETGMCLGR